MKRGEIRRLLKRLPKNNQQGFTLIELLVVISILGILAAVVTMSMVGITKVAQTRAGDTEKQSVQVAYDTMLAEMQVPSSAACPAAFGVGTSSNDMTDAGPIKLDYPGDDPTVNPPTHLPVALYPHYLREKKTHGSYHCTDNGFLVQDSYTP